MSEISIRPQPGKQEMFLSSPADIGIYGGAAGAGKTFALLIEPLRHVSNRKFGAVVFRRSMPEITKEGAMWDNSGDLYSLLNGQANINERRWYFPQGGRVTFSHIQYDKDLDAWRGSQIALMCFDQLETFTQKQFFYMLSRNRSTSGVRPYVRATCNPQPGWLAKFIDWWIDEQGYAIPERCGVLRWFIKLDDRIIWADAREELLAQYPDIPPKSVTFIYANLFDNKILMEKDPGYLANLKAQSKVDRERLLEGNWKIEPSAGNIFNKAWFGSIPAAPSGGDIVLFWDFASTEKELNKPDPDFTAATAMMKNAGRFTVLDCVDFQQGPAETEKRFVNISRQWAAKAKQLGARFKVRWEQEPGSASKRDAQRMAGLLAGLDAHAVGTGGKDKITRAKALSAQAEAGNVDLVEAEWNDHYLNHMHNQPDADHDDIMDSSSGAFNALTDESNLIIEMYRQQLEAAKKAKDEG